MMRRQNQTFGRGHDDDYDSSDEDTYFTYRPLSNLPTPPPTLIDDQAPRTQLDDGEVPNPRFLGPAVHLVNLIPSAASLATASVPLVQGMLDRAEVPLETIALAVCILDSLDTRFARRWRLTCPLASPYTGAAALSSSLSKRHSLPLTPEHSPLPQQLHIDCVGPELIVLAALVIAAKFNNDLEQPAQHYRVTWGRNKWSNEQLNATERCIMESLDYRIMPLCDEDCLTDAMVDMQLAGRQYGRRRPKHRELTPPDSTSGSDCEFIPGHTRSKTTLGLGVVLPEEQTCLS